jgi:hypothetical protein
VREIIRVWPSPSDRRRSARIRSTASCWSSATGRRPDMRVATRATECASVASVLRPCPVANTRARADSFGGTSTTCSPSASSLLAMCPPMPWQPSIAHVRSGHRRARASIARYPAASVAYRSTPSTVSSPAMISIVAHRLCGSIPITTLLIRSSCSQLSYRARRAPLLRARQTPLEPHLAHDSTRPAQAR